MPSLTVNGQIITFPDSSASPNWAPAIIQFAQAVSDALAATSGPYDVAPQTMTIDSYNTASNIDIAALSFPTSTVRAAFIHYAVYRSTNSANADEAGDMIIIYNPHNSSGLKWTLTQGNITGKGANINFNVTDNGQIQFTTTALSGSSHAGKIIFDARALQQA